MEDLQPCSESHLVFLFIHLVIFHEHLTKPLAGKPLGTGFSVLSTVRCSHAWVLKQHHVVQIWSTACFCEKSFIDKGPAHLLSEAALASDGVEELQQTSRTAKPKC